MAGPRVLYSTIVTILCIKMLTAPIFAQEFNTGLLPGLFPINPEEFRKCFQTVTTIPRCIEEILTSFLTIQLILLGTQCCKAALEIDDSCWPKIFPFNPFFPPDLKNFCYTQPGIIPPPPPPPLF
ncbi:hypothetical protein A4A49_16836 [Nicotiana attenuata]|uniref:Prolamin-like domain-containing protein n=1 Tax=Nicotiana attenuata TaxID=49451 RepID=A0A314KL43_NICAT|nr:hypothetical protein A4A49_16836 [Nicotiana attenuata]